MHFESECVCVCMSVRVCGVVALKTDQLNPRSQLQLHFRAKPNKPVPPTIQSLTTHKIQAKPLILSKKQQQKNK